MFKNPVMVSGYPIPKKPDRIGMEMPLNMMTGLVGEAQVIEFYGKVFIKGFSSMLIALKPVDDLLVWHYVSKATKERISFFDTPLEAASDLRLNQLDNMRHVVGWSSSCLYNAGKLARK